jgi:hypothetical protein
MESEDPGVQATKDAKDAEQKALTSLTDLIVATLKEATVTTRFQEAQRLCEVAQNLVKARARRAADFKEPEGQAQMGVYNNHVGGQIYAVNAVNNMANNGANNFNIVAGGNQMMADPGEMDLVDLPNGGRARRPRAAPPGRILFDDQGNLVNEQGIVYAGHLDANALMRHMLMAFGPHAQTGAEANRARVAHEEAVELKALVSIMSGSTDPERSILDRRVKQLMSNIERRSNANKPEPEVEVPVVPPDHPRGHQLDAGGAEGDAAPCLPAHVDGVPGDGGPPAARPLDQVGENAVV